MTKIPDRVVWKRDYNNTESLYIKNGTVWKPSSSETGKWQDIILCNDDKYADGVGWGPDPSVPAENVKWEEEEAPKFVIPIPLEQMSTGNTPKSVYFITKEYSIMKWGPNTEQYIEHYPYVPIGLFDDSTHAGYIYQKQDSGLWKLSKSVRIDNLKTATKKETSLVACQCDGTGWMIGDLGLLCRCSCKKNS